MTTHILTGFAIYWNEGVGDVGADFTDITLDLVIPNSTSSLSYSPVAYDDEEDDFFADIDIDSYQIRLNDHPSILAGKGRQKPALQLSM